MIIDKSGSMGDIDKEGMTNEERDDLIRKMLDSDVIKGSWERNYFFPCSEFFC